MPIHITDEPPISLTQAAAHIPRRRRGRKTAVSTLHRWATHGLRGVVLESIQVGGTRCTSLAALQRFFDRLSGLDGAVAHTTGCTQSHQLRTAQADQELDKRWSSRQNAKSKEMPL